MLLENAVLLLSGITDLVLHALVIQKKHVVTKSNSRFIHLGNLGYRSVIIILLLQFLRVRNRTLTVIIVSWDLRRHRLPQEWSVLSLQVHQPCWLLRVI